MEVETIITYWLFVLLGVYLHHKFPVLDKIFSLFKKKSSPAGESAQVPATVTPQAAAPAPPITPLQAEFRRLEAKYVEWARQRLLALADFAEVPTPPPAANVSATPGAQVVSVTGGTPST